MTDLLFIIYVAAPIFGITGLALLTLQWNRQNRWVGALIYTVMIVAALTTLTMAIYVASPEKLSS